MFVVYVFVLFCNHSMDELVMCLLCNHSMDELKDKLCVCFVTKTSYVFVV